MNYLVLTHLAKVTQTAVSAPPIDGTVSDIVQQAGQGFMDALSFLAQPGNFQMAVCAAVIFAIFSLLVKGTGKIVNVLLEAVALLVVIYLLLIALGINMDIPTFLSYIREGLEKIWTAVTGA